jgi:hypothetical protein
MVLELKYSDRNRSCKHIQIKTFSFGFCPQIRIYPFLRYRNPWTRWGTIYFSIIRPNVSLKLAKKHFYRNGQHRSFSQGRRDWSFFIFVSKITKDPESQSSHWILHKKSQIFNIPFSLYFIQVFVKNITTFFKSTVPVILVTGTVFNNFFVITFSVADPGCLSRIWIRPFFGILAPDPTVYYPGSRIRILQIREGKNKLTFFMLE